MRERVVVAAMAVVLAAASTAGAAEKQVVRDRGAFYVAPGGATVALPEGRSWLSVAPADAVGRNGQPDGDFTAVLVSRSPEVVLWLRTQELAPMITKRVRLAPSADLVGKPRKVGVTLYPGAEIELVERGEAAAHVKFDAGWVRGDGWVPLSAVGAAFSTEDMHASFLPDDTRTIPDEATFLEAPGGKPLVTVSRPPVFRQHLGRVDHGHVLVEIAFENVGVVGWIPRRALAKVEAPGGVLGMMLAPAQARPASGNGTTDYLVAGSDLFDRPGGVRLGRVTDETLVSVLEERDGMRRFDLLSEVGRLTLWAVPPAAPSKQP